MRDVGPSSALDDDAVLTTFVDRVAGSGGDRATVIARAQIRKTMAGGVAPAGLRRLAEALAASTGSGLPLPRHPVEDADSVAAAVQRSNLVVLDDFDCAAVAGAIAALVADGRRVVVTGPDREKLRALRGLLPVGTHGCCPDTLPRLTPAQMRILRRLLATATPGRRARASQKLPPAHVLPDGAEVATLCGLARRMSGTEAADLIPGLLSGLEPDRRAAVTGVARCVNHQLTNLPSRDDRPWAWTLLSDVVFNTHRTAFERLVEDTAQAIAATQRCQDAAPVTLVAPLPPGGVEVLRRHLAVLRSEGRTYRPFRSGRKREVAGVLRYLRVGDVMPETAEQIEAVLEHLDRTEQLSRVDEGCREVGIPSPRDSVELGALRDSLTKVSAAARSVGALRHDVLFIHQSSPVAVPDLGAAAKITAAILAYSEYGSPAEAQCQLDRLAAELAARATPAATAPEHDRAVAALRHGDAAGYHAAVEALVAARREVADQEQCVALLDRLREHTPELAQAWAAASESRSGGFGLAWFVDVDRLLTRLPGPDQADVVLVLGAAALGVERLLLTAVAPRLVAVRGSGGGSAGDTPNMLSVLARASALVVSGGAAAPPRNPTVARRLPPGASPRPSPAPKRNSVAQRGD